MSPRFSSFPRFFQVFWWVKYFWTPQVLGVPHQRGGRLWLRSRLHLHQCLLPARRGGAVGLLSGAKVWLERADFCRWDGRANWILATSKKVWNPEKNVTRILNLEQSSTEMCITGGHQLLRFFEESCQGCLAPFLCFFFAMPCYAQLCPVVLWLG